jgi:hypothetical protein
MHSRFALACALSLIGCSGTSITNLPDSDATDAGSGGTATGSDAGAPQPGNGSGQPPPGSDPTVTPSATTPVEIRNVSFAAAKSRGYGPMALDISFAIVNKAPRPIERLQEVSFTFGGQKKTFPAVCDGGWFGTLGTTRILTLHLEDGDGSGYLFPTCGEGVSGPTTLPWGNSVTVELRGLLDDATPWTASATGTR